MAPRRSPSGPRWLPPSLATWVLLFLSERRHRHGCAAFSAAGTSSAAARRAGGSSPSSIGRRPHRASTLASMSSFKDNGNYNNSDRTPRDVLVIGGGLAGLSAAHRIASRSSRHVTLLDRELPAQQRRRTAAGSFAAAGMLAPQSERLPAGPLLDICLRSREMYGEWVAGVERGAREASLGVSQNGRRRDGAGRNAGAGRNEMYSGEGAKYLWELTDDDGVLSSFDGGPSPPLEPWEVGFHSTGGFLAPAFAGDAVATWSPQPDSGKAYWLDDIQVRELEPQLHPDVVGGWWFPEDASVDARRLTCSLRAACVGAGVQMKFGPEWEVTSLEMSGGTCEGVHLANGKIYKPNAIIVANGAWMRHLLPLPVTPHKGQSFSLRMPNNAPPILSRVLFAQDTYIVPKADGRIIVGATVEPGKFDSDVTPSGMMHCLSEATRLIPSLGELPIEESWAGLRPTTPDKCPILGKTEQWDNVFIAGGYWRNGVLLAPKTGQLIGDLIVNNGDEEKMSAGDQTLLKAFSWERFTAPGGGKALAAAARYAATFYPVHKRSTDGVATSVGTELGFYEGAAAARGDREKDRKAMFGISAEEEEALERAAGMGVGDARAFSLGDGGEGWMVRRRGASDKGDDDAEDVSSGETVAVDADPDAFTIGVKEEVHDAEEAVDEATSVSLTEDLPSIYERIKANKAKASESIQMGDDPTEQRSDPGFRIYHVDSATRDVTEVPPFTSPGEFFQTKAEGKLPVVANQSEDGEPSSARRTTSKTATEDEQLSNDEEGGRAIRGAYGERTTAEETAEATRRARINNRIKTSEIDESKIGAMHMTNEPSSTNPTAEISSPSEDAQSTTQNTGNLSEIYDKIRANKAMASQNIEMGEPGEEERPKLNFTIYHVDSQTQEVRKVPQYTSPGEFLDMIESEKAADKMVVNGDRPKHVVPPVTNNGVDEESSDKDDDSGISVDASDQKIYDGYQAILSANSASSREEEMRRMKEARMENRAKASGIMGDSLDDMADIAPVTNTNIVNDEESIGSSIDEGKEEVRSDIIDDGSDEKTYDGYQAIQAANSAESRDEELRRMKEARMANRAKASSIMGDSLDSLNL